MTSSLLVPLFLIGGLAQTPAVGRSASPKPFARLFQRPDADLEITRRALQHRMAEIEPPRVVCGMRVYRADPQVDPRFVKTVPADTSRMAIRRIPPPACAD